MPIVLGTKLSAETRAHVLRAFIYRWTLDNTRCEEVYERLSKPTIAKITDEQWLAERAFYITKSGKLDARRTRRSAIQIRTRKTTMKAITTKFHGPTNSRGSRISASDCDNNKVTLSYEHALNAEQNHDRAAIALCKKMKWQGPLMRGGTKDGNVYVFDAHWNHLRFESFEFAYGEVKIA